LTVAVSVIIVPALTDVTGLPDAVTCSVVVVAVEANAAGAAAPAIKMKSMERQYARAAFQEQKIPLSAAPDSGTLNPHNADLRHRLDMRCSAKRDRKRLDIYAAIVASPVLPST
jgi:hypothetical protein